MRDIEPTALTLRIQEGDRVFASEVAVSDAFDPDSGLEHPPAVKCAGIWDTGATGSVISKGGIEYLGLQSIDMISVETANGVRESHVYLVNILLPSNVGFQGLRVTEGDIGGADVLIGMDIICVGDLAITHDEDGSIVMSYRMPPDFGRTTDFVKRINLRKAMQKSRTERLQSKKKSRCSRQYRHG